MRPDELSCATAARPSLAQQERVSVSTLWTPNDLTSRWHCPLECRFRTLGRHHSTPRDRIHRFLVIRECFNEQLGDTPDFSFSAHAEMSVEREERASDRVDERA